jgi:hypothetical protein
VGACGRFVGDGLRGELLHARFQLKPVFAPPLTEDTWEQMIAMKCETCGAVGLPQCGTVGCPDDAAELKADITARERPQGQWRGMMSAEKAAKAHTDLNTFGAIISILEGGHLYGIGSDKTVQQIIRLCKRECQRCLRVYDQNIATLKGNGEG